MSSVSSTTVTMTVSTTAMLEDKDPNKIDDEAKDGNQEEPLMFHLKRINRTVS